ADDSQRSTADLYEQVPIVVNLIRQMPGDDREDYWLGVLKNAYSLASRKSHSPRMKLVQITVGATAWPRQLNRWISLDFLKEVEICEVGLSAPLSFCCLCHLALPRRNECDSPATCMATNTRSKCSTKTSQKHHRGTQRVKTCRSPLAKPLTSRKSV